MKRQDGISSGKLFERDGRIVDQFVLMAGARGCRSDSIPPKQYPLKPDSDKLCYRSKQGSPSSVVYRVETQLVVVELKVGEMYRVVLGGPAKTSPTYK